MIGIIPAWVRIRDDMVHLKGKGLHETYWLNVGSASLGSRASSLSDDSSVAVSNADADGSKTDMNDTLWEDAILAGVLGQSKTDAEIERLIDWNVDVMVPLLRSIIAKGAASGKSLESQMIPPDKEKPANHEVQMEIALPAFDADLDAKIALKTNVKVPPIVKKELRDYIAAIATGYPKNPCKSLERSNL